MRSIPVVTIDGPAGSGKGTISQRVSKELKWRILDSGALYRIVALAAQRRGLDLTNVKRISDSLTSIAENLDVTFRSSAQGGVEVALENDIVTQAIRSESCGCSASQVAAIDSVRKALLNRQRQFLEMPGLVADGRDMGTVVFPNAKAKIFLTASPEIRGMRRLNQLKECGIDANLLRLIRDIEERDARDINRKVAPLVPADDAVVVDSGKLTINEVVEIVMGIVKQVY